MSTPFRLQVPLPIFEAMLEQARAELPNECCGLLAGSGGLVTVRYALTNALASPQRYEADTSELVKAFADMRARQVEHLAIYHSHPTSDPVPSRTDMELAFYSAVVYLIISLQEQPPRMRGWWLSESGYREAEVEIIPPV